MDSKIEFNELCRLCLAKNHVGIPIFEGEGHDEVFLKISTCLPVNISYEDKLPKRICTNCLNKLNILYKFCNKSANSEKQLLDWFNQYGTANETSIDSNADYETAQSDSEIEIKEEALSFLTDEDDNIKIEDTDMENYNILQDIPKQGNDISNEQCSDTIGFNAVTNGTEVEVKQENDDDDDGKPKTTNLQPEVNTKYAKVKDRLCIVPNCNGINNTKNVFHRVPRDYETRQKWFKIIHRSDLMGKPYRELQGRKVCGAHFTSAQYKYPEKLLQLHIYALPSYEQNDIKVPFVKSKSPPIPTLPQRAIAGSFYQEWMPLPILKVTRTYSGKRKKP